MAINLAINIAKARNSNGLEKKKGLNFDIQPLFL